MPDYKKLYHKTFNAITDVERLIETAVTMLRIVQQECEDLYVEVDDTPVFLLDADSKETKDAGDGQSKMLPPHILS